jgi:hypothetical protein
MFTWGLIMGRDVVTAEAGEKTSSKAPEINFAEQMLAEFISEKEAKTFDPSAPAPKDAGRRMWDVTVGGIKEIPNGFINSLDPSNILPNVGMGLAIGAVTKLALAEGGPVAKVAGGLMTAYFLGKPITEVYGKAVNAQTMGEMQEASVHLGNTLGGLPVTAAEGIVGAKLGAGLAGGLLSTRAAAPFVEWKGRQYAKLDAHIDSGVVSANNFAFEKFGVGRPIMRSSAITGFVPPYVLEELAGRNPSNPAFLDTIRKIEAYKPQERLGSALVEIEQSGAREVYDAQGKETVGIKVRSEGQPKIGDIEVDNVYDYTGDVRSLYKEVYNRNSIDNRGMSLQSTVNYGQNFENAFWDGTRMTYGKPGADSPFKSFVLRDVTGHEMTHGVTQFEANVVYRGQPGALNESLSDVFGALVEQRARGQAAGQASWLVGEGIWKSNIKGRALRDMLNPGTAYDDVMVGKDPQPAHMKDFVQTRRDNGGVHLNSGIPNRAFALFAQDVGGFAWEGPGKIWYKARANAGSTPSFAQFAQHTLEAAKQLGYTAEIPKLEKAWSSVGVKPSLIDAGLPKVGLPLILFASPDQKSVGSR